MSNKGTRLGSYDIFATRGSGGMGAVYRADDTTLNRDVALAFLPRTPRSSNSAGAMMRRVSGPRPSPRTQGNGPPHDEVAHFPAAAVIFAILAVFCYFFYRRATAKGHREAWARAAIYVVCGVAIVVAIVTLALNGLRGNPLNKPFPRVVFVGDATGLLAFGISWLVASRTLPVITARQERFSPLAEHNPA